MSFSRLFYAFAAFLFFASGFIVVAPSLINVDVIYPTRIDSTYLVFRQNQNYFTDSIANTLIFNPGDEGVPFTELKIETYDGLILEGWYSPAADTPAHTLIILHELNQSKLLYLDQIRQFYDRGLNVFIYDLRAHGSSDGVEFSAGNPSVLDARSVLRTVRSLPGTNKIILCGTGIGANIALQAALDDTLCSGLVLENPVSSIRSFIDRYSYTKWQALRILWAPMLKRRVAELLEAPLQSAEMDQMIAQTKIPVLFLTGSEDSIAFTSETLELYQRSVSEKKELFLIRNAGHLNMAAVGREKYYNRIATFINVNFPKKKKSRFKRLAIEAG